MRAERTRTRTNRDADVKAFASADEIKNALFEQLFRPVRWIETVQSFAGDGVTTVVECVPGKVLAGLNKRIDGNLNCLAVTNTASLLAAIDATQPIAIDIGSAW